MRKLGRAHLIAAGLVLGFGVAVLIATANASTVMSAQPLPPMLTPQQMTVFEITQALDVSSNPGALTVPPVVSSSQAIDIASRHLGRSQTNVRLLHALAKPIHEYPARSVWIVMFAGGALPVLGPAGNTITPRPMQFAAVEVDDTTGEVLTWFMN
jgi:hypothetical protein